jgi:hypothetical protein
MSSTSFFETKYGHLLRWIFFIPFSFLGAILISFLLNILFFEELSGSIFSIFPPVLFTTIFFVICSIVIPTKKKQVLWLMFSLLVASSLFWFVDPSTSDLSLPMLIIREIVKIGFVFWYIVEGVYEE